MKLKIITYCLFAVAFITTTALNAQVTIGKDIEPDAYSVLQVEHDPDKYESGAGVLLPRLDDEAIFVLENKIKTHGAEEQENAVGLIVYNTTIKKVVYWNGTNWIPIPSEIIPTFSASNGLEANRSAAGDMTTVGLGGNIDNHTEINLNNHVLKIEQSGNAAFGVKSEAGRNVLSVNNNKVGINTDNPTALLHIEKQEETVGFRYADGTQAPFRALTLKNPAGDAHWEDIKTNVISEGGKITYVPDRYIHKRERTTGKTVKCSKGKWLIIAQVNTTSANPANTNVTTSYDYQYTRIKVRKRAANATQGSVNDVVLAASGETTEFGGYQVALPGIAFYYVFEDDNNTLELWAEGKTSTYIDPYMSVDLGHLYAIRLSEETKN